MFSIGDKVVPVPEAAYIMPWKRIADTDQKFLYVVGMSKYKTYMGYAVSRFPYYSTGEILYVHDSDIVLYDAESDVDQVIKKVHRAGVLKRKIDIALRDKNKAAFLEAAKELKEIEE